jgi:hypothetical protein
MAKYGPRGSEVDQGDAYPAPGANGPMPMPAPQPANPKQVQVPVHSGTPSREFRGEHSTKGQELLDQGSAAERAGLDSAN